MSYTALRQTLADALGTAYQLPEDDIATILPEKEDEFKESDFKNKFLELDRERIANINQKGKEKFEQGYSKAKKEVLSDLEENIRLEFNIDDDELRGIDLVKKVAELNAKKSKADPTKLSEDELKSHPAVIKLLNEKDKSFQAREQELKEGYESKLNTFHKESRFNKVSKRALSILDSMNPVLSSDPQRAANQKSILLRELEGLDYQEEGDNFTPLDKDGKRLENEHGHGVNFEQLVKSKAEKYFDFKKADDRGNPAPPDGDGNPGGSKVPKNEQEYAQMITDRTIPREDREKIKEAWNKRAES